MTKRGFALALGLCVLVSVFARYEASAGEPPPRAHAAQAAPPGLLRGLSALDGSLDSLIAGVRSGELSGTALADLIKEQIRFKDELIVANGNEPVYGVPFRTVYFTLQLARQKLQEVEWIATGRLDIPRVSDKEAILNRLDSALVIKQLEAELRKKTPNQGGHGTAVLEDVHDKLTKLISDVQNDRLDMTGIDVKAGSLAQSLRLLGDVTDLGHVKIFGVLFPTVFDGLYHAHYGLNTAMLVARGELSPANSLLANDQQEILKWLEFARGSKKFLETTFREVRPCTIKGTAKGETIEGTNGSNVICGGGGGDKINAKDGTDVVKGGPGNDVINGGKGADVLDGGKGKDVLIGGPGDDACARSKPDVEAKCDSAPECRPGSAFGGTQKITVAAGETKLAWFWTPIPNHFYYLHRGFDNGGCDRDDGKMAANIQVIGSDLSVIAYTYDDPPAGSGRTASGEDCPAPFPPDDQIRTTCKIFRPDLSFNAKDANDVKTYSVAVSVQNARGDGAAATASLKVAVTWHPK